MFGLKVVKEQEVLNLKRQLENTQALLEEKNAMIKSLESEINNLNHKILELSKVENQTKKKDVYLLTDVSETPLKVEEKPKRTSTKKTTTRKKIVRKQEELV